MPVFSCGRSLYIDWPISPLYIHSFVAFCLRSAISRDIFFGEIKMYIFCPGHLMTYLPLVSLDKKPILGRPSTSADASATARLVQDVDEHQQHETTEHGRCT